MAQLGALKLIAILTLWHAVIGWYHRGVWLVYLYLVIYCSPLYRVFFLSVWKVFLEFPGFTVPCDHFSKFETKCANHKFSLIWMNTRLIWKCLFFNWTIENIIANRLQSKVLNTLSLLHWYQMHVFMGYFVSIQEISVNLCCSLQ
jgi:hypothetical protein